VEKLEALQENYFSLDLCGYGCPRNCPGTTKNTNGNRSITSMKNKSLASRIIDVSFIILGILLVAYFAWPTRDTEKAFENLKSSDRTKRLEAVIHLGIRKNKQAVKPLILILKNDKDTGVRASAARSLGKIARGNNDDLKKQVCMSLIEALKDKSIRVASKAALALYYLDDSRGFTCLQSMAKDKQRDNRWAAIKALR